MRWCTAARTLWPKSLGVVLRDDKLPPAQWWSSSAWFRQQLDPLPPRSRRQHTFLRGAPGPYTAVALQDARELDWARAAVLQPYLKGDTCRGHRAKSASVHCSKGEAQVEFLVIRRSIAAYVPLAHRSLSQEL